MSEIIRFFLPIYFVVYFGIAFVLKSIIVAKRIGKNMFVLPKDDSAYGLIGFYFKLTLTGMFIYTIAYAFFPEWHKTFLTIEQLDWDYLKLLGLALLGISLVWTIIAQTHMKNSWRIGIDATI